MEFSENGSMNAVNSDFNSYFASPIVGLSSESFVASKSSSLRRRLFVDTNSPFRNKGFSSLCSNLEQLKLAKENRVDCCSAVAYSPLPLHDHNQELQTELITSADGQHVCEDLIADFSKPFALPLVNGKHPELKSISSDTLARLITGQFRDKIATYEIVDCRFPYEYHGGHICGAMNMYTKKQIVQEFLPKQKSEDQHMDECSMALSNKRKILVFHCEFSAQRGPKLLRFLRQQDRSRNFLAYPELEYPEVYLLHNGYKEFYSTHPELCDPAAYTPMNEPSYNEAYKYFKAESKAPFDDQ